MASYILTNKAVDDLTKIWDYTFEVWSEKQADKYYSMLHNAFQDLADDKISGKHYGEVMDDLFGFKVGQHIVFYRKLKIDKIEIVRILHNRMDLKSRMQE
ncbi:MAG: type II toxin-antitoxin system RelE/ParE family toxin [Dinghuibacter sp.]|nr:type II toxin-antitoxin system RelE/ParE family toxin [Dinghuibacter sp.]